MSFRSSRDRHRPPAEGNRLRVAVVAECFLPEVNGVTNSVLRVLEHLDARGHDAVVVCPAPADGHVLHRARTRSDDHGRAHVVRLPSFSLPRYPSLSIALPTPRLESLLRAYAPDVVHLAAPVVLGAGGASAARRLGIPSVAVYQTDLAGFAERYGLGATAPAIWGWLRKVHRSADLTLAPSSAAARQLAANGIGPVAHWGRGVDLDRFHPDRRCETWRREVAPNGEVIVGYVGRLALEKDVQLLAAVEDLPGVQVVVVGDGPDRERLEGLLPRARFLGFQGGTELARSLASLDVFVHTGAHETFCQTIQEAQASGVAVVAPAAGGPLDLVDHGRSGWLVPAGDHRRLRAAVAALVADPLRRAALGDAGRSGVADRSWERLGDELLDHYRSVLDGTVAHLPAA